MATTVSQQQAHCDQNPAGMESSALPSTLPSVSLIGANASNGPHDDGRPFIHRRLPPNKDAENRPKSGKVLIRKNTPALLPKVDKICSKDLCVTGPALAEEEEETTEQTPPGDTPPPEHEHN